MSGSLAPSLGLQLTGKHSKPFDTLTMNAFFADIAGLKLIGGSHDPQADPKEREKDSKKSLCSLSRVQTREPHLIR